MRYEEYNLTKEEAAHIILLIGQRIKAKRTAQGIPQMVLAKILAFQKGSLSRIESGKTNLKVYCIHKIAVALNVKEHELLVGVDHSKQYSFESLLLLQAKFRRLGNRVEDTNKTMRAMLTAFAAADSYRERVLLHTKVSEQLAIRGKILEEQQKITEAMHRKEPH